MRSNSMSGPLPHLVIPGRIRPTSSELISMAEDMPLSKSEGREGHSRGLFCRHFCRDPSILLQSGWMDVSAAALHTDCTTAMSRKAHQKGGPLSGDETCS